MKQTLDTLPIGITARVEETEHGTSTSQRLMTMGLLPGCQVKVVQHAPLGDPIAIEFDGQLVSLRRSEAAGVYLKPVVQ
jgi:ferrous iron transport protein A